MSFLNELLTTITQRDTHGRRRALTITGEGHERVGEACRLLLASDGEASSVALARHTLDLYEELDEAEKLRFFLLLSEEYLPEPDAVGIAYDHYRSNPTAVTLQALFQQCEPPRHELLRRLNLAQRGTYDLLRMRADMLPHLAEHPELRAVDEDFVHLFRSWFNRGFLVLRRVDWNMSASILEKIIQYEAVHEIRDWDDLRRRLAPADRRCFAFFHPATGNEPLIFVEVALTRGLPERIQPVLQASGEPGDTPDTAAFFGISNCQDGLRRISFGNFLIKQVMQELKRELPSLKHFVTLSPIPGFARWINAEREDPASPLDEASRRALAELDEPEWHRCDDRSARLRELVLAEAARYLLEARNRRGYPENPVARFHLRNGARLQRINWLGDVSDKGLSQGYGLMVNYLYALDQIETNHERYVADGKVACSNEIRKLARQNGKWGGGRRRNG